MVRNSKPLWKPYVFIHVERSCPQVTLCGWPKGRLIEFCASVIIQDATAWQTGAHGSVGKCEKLIILNSTHDTCVEDVRCGSGQDAWTTLPDDSSNGYNTKKVNCDLTVWIRKTCGIILLCVEWSWLAIILVWSFLVSIGTDSMRTIVFRSSSIGAGGPARMWGRSCWRLTRVIYLPVRIVIEGRTRL